MKFIRETGLLAAATLVACWWNPICAADPPLKATVKTAAEGITAIVDTIDRALAGKAKEISVRPFKLPQGVHRENELALINELKSKRGYTIKAGTTDLEGRYFPLLNSKGQLDGYRMVCELVSTSDGKKLDFQVHVEDRENAHIILNGSGQYGPYPRKDDETEKRNDAQVSNGQATPSEGSGYRVEVAVKSADGQFVRRPVLKDGDDFKVDLKKGEVFRLKVHNDYEYEAAISVKLDGISRFSLAKDPALARRDLADIVDPKSSREVLGFYVDEETNYEFKVSDFKDSVVAKLLPDSHDLRTIIVAFRAAWKKGEPIPPYEKQSTIASVGVGTGGQVNDRTKIEPREKGRLRAVIKIRYSCPD